MPDIWSDAYQHMIAELPDYRKVSRDTILTASQRAIETIRNSLSILKGFCQNHHFNDQASEIQFFKSVKPRFQAQLIFWTSLFDIALQRPVGGVKHEMKYLKKRMSSIEDYFNSHKEFYSYYRSAQTDRDTVYFTRNLKIPQSSMSLLTFDVDPAFYTSHGFLVAGILANDILREYLLHEMYLIKSSKNSSKTLGASNSLHWTASKSGLVELVYSLYAGGVFNNGKALVSEIASAFQEKFDIRLVNYYHTFNEIRLRKKNRTAFMENLRDKLSKKMNELEGE
jgi:hypothetical protein